MRVITGSGKLIREYIKNLINFDNIVVKAALNYISWQQHNMQKEQNAL